MLCCPHCQHPLESVQLQSDTVCTACGSSLHFDAATTAWNPQAGQRRLGKFELIDQVGVGSFGTVFRARDTELDRVVAVKIPRGGHMGTTGGDADRFIREARASRFIVSLF